MTRLNLEPLDRALAHIEAHPDQWAQDTWIYETDCGTRGCLFGWAALLAGGRPARGGVLLHTDPTERGAEEWPPGAWAVRVDQRIQNLCGLTDAEAERLASPANTLDDLRRLMAELHETARDEAAEATS